MAKVHRIALFEREVRERMSKAAVELVLARAEVMSEGQRATRGGREVYFGSTMLTIDLPSLAPLLREPCDAATARRLAALLEGDPDLAAQVKVVAAREAGRLAGVRPTTISTEIRSAARGPRVFVDIDVEGTF